MRRLVPLTRKSSITALVIAAYAVLRAGASLGRPVARFADTTGYESLRFIGSIDRFWPVPLVFHLFDADVLRVAAQIVIGVAAWAWLAVALARTSRFPLTMSCAVLLVGLSPQVIRYDLAILSESLGISLAVMAVTATVSLTRSRSNGMRIIWSATMTTCAMTRPVHLIVLFACAAWCLLRFLRSSRIPSAIPVLTLGVLSIWGLMLLHGNRSTSMLNMYTVLAERVVPNDARYAWFTTHGMPDIPGVRESEGYDFAGDLPPDVASIVSLPTGQAPPALIRAGGVPLATWVRDHGWPSYARYVLTHPSDSWNRLTDLASPTLSPRNDDFLPLQSRTIIPRTLFGDWRIWTLAGFAAIAFSLLRSANPALSTATMVMYGLTFTVHAAALFTSGIEHPRHSVTVAVMLRVLPLVAVSMIAPARRLTTPGGSDDEPG